MAKHPKRNAGPGAETGAIRKNWQGRIKIALAWPGPYSVGMGNLGFQAVYGLLNQLDHVVCERVFLTDEPGKAPLSMESKRPLAAFDAVAFSLSFENDYPAVLAMLENGGVPLLAEKRGAAHPLVFAGGVAALLNPEPLALFFDLFCLGEAEAWLKGFVSAFDPRKDRPGLLLELANGLPGTYVPSLYTPTYDSRDRLKDFEPDKGAPAKVKKALVPDLENVSTHTRIVSPDTAFDDAFVIEVGRGCPHGCRFCAAGYVYRPVRFRSVEHLGRDMERGGRFSKKIGLLGAAVSDLPGLDRVCALASEREMLVSFSSFRADNLTPGLIDAIAASGQKTATIAPEAGSERLRKVIKKGITEEHVLQAARTLVAAGVPNLKLYFMVGLPTETPQDVEAIGELVKKTKEAFLEASRPLGRMGRIQVTLSSFVPKPHTPFQWAPMDSVAMLKKKIKAVKKSLGRVPNVEVFADVPKWAYLQGLLARGDRRVGEILLLARKNQGNWPQTYKQSPIHPDFFVLREREKEERLPWDFMDLGIKKDFLRREYEKALGLKEG